MSDLDDDQRSEIMKVLAKFKSLENPEVEDDSQVLAASKCLSSGMTAEILGFERGKIRRPYSYSYSKLANILVQCGYNEEVVSRILPKVPPMRMLFQLGNILARDNWSDPPIRLHPRIFE